MRRYLYTFILLLAMAVVQLQIDTQLPLHVQWQLLLGAEPANFAGYQYWFSSLPRVAMALLVGGVMGLTGSLLQQLLQNPLVSPMTIGAASGAWLGVVLMTLISPVLAAVWGSWAAMAGAISAVLLVMLIAGRSGLRGLPVVLAGMAVNLLLGGVASGLVLLNEQYARNLFIWGAGDLAQTDWQWVEWLFPRLWPLPLLLLMAARPLILLRLGDTAAQGRGMSLLPVMLLLMLAALWLTAVSITAVGLIGFIGLLTPNLARLLGSHGARDELGFSLLLGSLLLLATDTLALLFSKFLSDLVPSGAAAALIGAPALIWLARNRLTGDDTERRLPSGRQRLHPCVVGLMLLSIMLSAVFSLTLAPGNAGWHLGWPDDLILSLRWPRVLAAASAGAALAVAGVVLQRLIRNPLASPDILGLSAGATLALVMNVMIFGGSVREAGPMVALGGSLAALLLLLLLGRRHHYAPGMMALMGISLAALLDAVVQFSLARGTHDTTAILGWLAGSTYRISPFQALMLAAGTLLGGGLALLARHALTLIAIGDEFAAGRGLDRFRVRIFLLLLVALLTALVTSMLGPVAFVGLLAPHMATLLGARQTVPQLLVAAGVGTILMLLADWFGRILVWPQQIPAGLLASVVGGSYFVWLLARRRLS
ncbi:iron complex transport system permease protein [Marinobacterium halophilum]|uniref:Iron complex transport system permease protein n=1 Tax=Marinobacterium halophilum TaxID=267374 RepID=A0A2P8EYW3_9GAMM|nr:Fe(3+)-hydroxamate ABC transporter permease FhuB [Marinobacterium halophilum]PSL14635.1 iron complex transport system permease protein [Marinobacterium halophilum]